MRYLTKKTIILALIFLVIASLGLFLWRMKQTAQISNDGTLSARGASYLKQKSLDDTSPLKNVDLTQGQKRINERVYAGNCFSFVIPFDIWDVQPASEDECSVRVTTDNPRVTFVAFQRPGTFDSIDSVEGVGFRRLEKEVYHESVKKIGRNQWYIFTKSDPVEYTAYHLHPDPYLILTMTTSGTDDYEKEFLGVLGSVEFK